MVVADLQLFGSAEDGGEEATADLQLLSGTEGGGRVIIKDLQLLCDTEVGGTPGAPEMHHRGCIPPLLPKQLVVHSLHPWGGSWGWLFPDQT